MATTHRAPHYSSHEFDSALAPLEGFIRWHESEEARSAASETECESANLESWDLFGWEEA